jgi:hypothetical protein
MYLNFATVLNDLLEGVVFYVYAHLHAMYLIGRFPFRGPQYLALLNARRPQRSVGPHSFFLLNLISVFLFTEVVSLLLFTNLKQVVVSLGAQFEQAVNSKIDWLPLVLRSLTILISADLVLRLVSLAVPGGRPHAMLREAEAGNAAGSDAE